MTVLNYESQQLKVLRDRVRALIVFDLYQCRAEALAEGGGSAALSD